MLQQISKLEVEDYNLEFEWIIQDLWNFQWMDEDYLVSKTLNFKEANVSSAIKFYPNENTFTFLNGDNFAYGNAHFDIKLGEYDFGSSWKFDYKLRLSSEMMDDFYVEEDGSYKFPFSISYTVGHYDEDFSNSELDIDYENNVSSGGSENEEFVMVDEKKNESVVDSEVTSSVFEDPKMVVENSAFVSELTDVESIEIIDDKHPDFLPSTSSRHSDEEDLNASHETSVVAARKLSDISRETVRNILSNQYDISDILIDNYKTFSIDERTRIAKCLSKSSKIHNFFDILTCAEFWQCSLLKEFVVKDLLNKLDCKELLSSNGWKDLKSNAALYAEIVEIISNGFLHKDFSSPIVFFL